MRAFFTTVTQQLKKEKFNILKPHIKYAIANTYTDCNPALSLIGELKEKKKEF